MKKCLLLLLCIFILSGCTITRMDTKNYEEVMDEILSLDINLYNKVGKGYKYYAPRGVVRTDANTYNDVLKRGDITYYLYVDVVSYYYKADYDYKVSDDSYYSSLLKEGKKEGYFDITEKDDKLYVQMVYNYAKIETYVEERELKTAIEDISYILSSVEFNDSLLKEMHEAGEFGSKEEVYKLFDNKEKEGNFLEYIEEYDKYEAEDEDVAPESEIEVKETTTTKENTTTKTTTTTETNASSE